MTLPYTLSATRPKQIGLIVLQADETLERDMRCLLPADLELLVSRVPSGATLNPDTLRAMEDHLTAAAALLPRGADCAAVGYGCTSGTAEIGAARISALVQAGIATPEVTEPVSALIAACSHLKVTNIGVVSPYIASVSDTLRRVLRTAGVEVSAFASFDEDQEARVVRIAQTAIRDAAIAMGKQSECQAIFLSCTNLRTLSVIDEIEQEIGKPVLSSNQVLAWHLCQIAGVACLKDAPGRLNRVT